jgi:hypothetical protein
VLVAVITFFILKRRHLQQSRRQSVQLIELMQFNS